MERFIVGTGRCGSTLLSRMLAENPTTLSIFEFFTGLDWGRRFAREPVGGGDFAALISQQQPFVNMVLARGYDVPEITYPFGPEARYGRADGLPWLLVTAISRMSDDPDTLFDETLDFASQLPHQHLSSHYRQLFGWWAERMGCRLWLERSGSSVDYLESLQEFFPDARFVHLHRDGPEAALSMREHHAYRLAVALMFRSPAEQDLAAAPEGRDPIARILESRPPVEWFGRYWSDQLVRGFRALRLLDADRYLELRFEDLLARPAAVLRQVCEFLEIDSGPEGWIDRAAGLVRGTPPTRLDKLPEAQRERLVEACRAGSRLLGRA